MTYSMRLDRIIQNLLTVEDSSEAQCLSGATADLTEIMHELDAEPKASEPNVKGTPMTLLAAVPYPHPDDRDKIRVALYQVPGDPETFKQRGRKRTVPTGEFYLCTESREEDHDGYREPNRFWGHYFGYGRYTDTDSAYIDAMKALGTKVTNLVSPFRRED